MSRNGYTYVKNNPLKYVDPTGQINWDTMWEGAKQTFWGVVDTAVGAVTTVGGVALATGGTATGVGAVPGIAVGVAAVGFGTNNIVTGSTKAWGGVTNLWNSVFNDQETTVDYTYNPASEAVDSLIPEDSRWNTAAHVAYDIADIAVGLKVIPSALSKLSNEIKPLLKTENTLIKANAGVKPASSLFGSSASKIHLPFAPIAEVVAGISSYFTYGNEAYVDNK